MSIDPSIKVIKRQLFRGTQREWSNRYYFDNLAPTDSAHWTTLSDAIVAAEKATLQTQGSGQIVQTYGYDAGSDVPVFSKAYATNFTGAFANVAAQAGEVCALVRYSTSAKTTKNHPVYLFNYVHSAVGSSVLAADLLNPAQKTALETYASAWVTGFSDGAVTHHRCGPNGHTATGYLVDQYLHHRDFPRG